jgi:hypothetical protein
VQQVDTKSVMSRCAHVVACFADRLLVTTGNDHGCISLGDPPQIGPLTAFLPDIKRRGPERSAKPPPSFTLVGGGLAVRVAFGTRLFAVVAAEFDSAGAGRLVCVGDDDSQRHCDGQQAQQK